MNYIEVHGLSKQYGTVLALQNVSFCASLGETISIVGASGSGKSTLLNIVAGLVAPDSGVIQIDNVDVTRLPPRERNVGMVFQDSTLYPHMSVEKNLGFPLKLRRMKGEDVTKRVRDTAEQLGIADIMERRPDQLSGGQQQRVALGRALVKDPSILLLDEPLSSLDAKLRDSTRTYLKQVLKTRTITTLFVTHDQEEAIVLGDRILLLDGGRVSQFDTSARLYHLPACVFSATFFGRPEMNILRGEYIYSTFGAELVVNGHRFSTGDLGRGIRCGSEVLIGIRPLDIRIGHGSQDDVSLGQFRVVEVEDGVSAITAGCVAEGLWIRIRTDQRVRHGDLLSLSTASQAVHLFDVGTGLRLQ